MEIVIGTLNIANKLCYVNRNSSAMFDIDLQQSYDPLDEFYNFMLNRAILTSLGMTSRNFETGHEMDVVYYMNDDKIENRHLYFEKIVDNEEITDTLSEVKVYGSHR